MQPGLHRDGHVSLDEGLLMAQYSLWFYCRFKGARERSRVSALGAERIWRLQCCVALRRPYRIMLHSWQVLNLLVGLILRTIHLRLETVRTWNRESLLCLSAKTRLAEHTTYNLSRQCRTVVDDLENH